MMMINIYICQWLILRALLDIHIHMIVSTKILKSMIKLQIEKNIYIYFHSVCFSINITINALFKLNFHRLCYATSYSFNSSYSIPSKCENIIIPKSLEIH